EGWLMASVVDGKRKVWCVWSMLPSISVRVGDSTLLSMLLSTLPAVGNAAAAVDAAGDDATYC
ncbi:hypothetical protein V491_06933, partial [Pseudogymnoascus sp. VKM F-3775]